MLFGLTQVCLPCRDLALSLRFYSDLLGFPLLRRSDLQADLDANGGGIRLCQTDSNIGPSLRLRLHTTEPAEAVRELIAQGASRGAATRRSAELEWIGEIVDPDGHRLELWCALSEDELDFVPDLPTSLEWTSSATALLQALLAGVPESFRAPARENTVRTAEYLAGSSLRVGRREAIRGFVRATPRLRRDQLKPALRQQAIDPADYRRDFDS